MIKFIKELFCIHEYERADNTLSNWYSMKTGVVVLKCKKCGKTKSEKVF